MGLTYFCFRSKNIRKLFKVKNMEKKGEEREKLKVDRIKDGTVLDHIEGGQSPNVCRILKIEAGTTKVVTVAINVPSKRMKRKRKDIVKIEGRGLETKEIHAIAIIAPEATINIIKDFEVVEKTKVKLPEEIIGILKCGNDGCITNATEPREPVTTRFHTENKDREFYFRCHYCNSTMTQSEAVKAIV